MKTSSRITIGNTVRAVATKAFVSDLKKAMQQARTTKACKKLVELAEEYPNGGEEYEDQCRKVKLNLPCARFSVQYFTNNGANTAENAVFNGLVLLDVDDMEDIDVWWDGLAGCSTKDLREKTQKRRLFLKENKIYFIQKSPRLHGVHVVFEAQEGESIAAAQARMAKILGLNNYDKGCKDICRATYLACSDYVLHIDENGLAFDGSTEAQKWAALTEAAKQNNSTEGDAPSDAATISANESSSVSEYPEMYSYTETGEEFPYKLIVENYIENRGGIPTTVGTRHTWYRDAAWDIRYICDFDARHLFALLPDCGLDEAERWSLCSSACSKERALNMNDALRRAIRQCHSDLQTESHEETVEKYDIKGMGLPPLAGPMKMIIPKIPVAYRQAMVVASTVPYGVLATKVRMQYMYDQSETAFNFGCIAVGPPSSGKSFYKTAFDLILSPMKEQDELAYKEETAYKEACRKLKNAKEQPTPPKTLARETSANITEACFASKCDKSHSLGDVHLYMQDDEIQRAVQAQKSWLFLKTAMVKSYDNGVWGQERVSESGVTAKAPIYLNYMFCGTPPVVEKFIDSEEVANGLASRVMFCTLNDSDDFPQWGSYTESEKKEIYDFSLKMMQESGEIRCPWIDDAITKWIEETKTRPFASEEYGKQYLRRAALSAWRAGYLWALMEGIAMHNAECVMRNAECAMRNEQQEIREKNIEYTLWIADYVYAHQESFFNEKVKALGRIKSYQSPYIRYGRRQLYADLPAVFTRNDMIDLQIKNNYNAGLDSILHYYRENGMIRNKDNTQYEKTV